MRVFLQDSSSSSSTRRRKAHFRSWLAAVATTVLLAALANGTASAATRTTIGDDDPTVINYWNVLATTTLANDTTKPPPEHILYMAFVQAAVYDAVVGVEGRYKPYRFHAHAAPWRLGPGGGDRGRPQGPGDLCAVRASRPGRRLCGVAGPAS